MVVKTLISAQPILQHNYRSVLPADNDGLSCFELLGMDVMLDHKLKPWLVEVRALFTGERCGVLPARLRDCF